MATLVFDIETTSQPVENFDDVQQEYLFREAFKINNLAEREAKQADGEQNGRVLHGHEILGDLW